MASEKKVEDLKVMLNKAYDLGLFGMSPNEKKELMEKTANPKSVNKILNNLKQRLPKDLNTFDT